MKLHNPKTRQTGAALVVSLIMLLVTSILAISSINSATTELAMARNDMNYENAFQAAETGLENALAQRPFNTLADVDLAPIDNGYDKVETRIVFEDSTLVPDRAFSLGVGSGISAFHFNVTATAVSKRDGSSGATTDRDASAIHTQAFYIIGPEPPTL